MARKCRFITLCPKIKESDNYRTFHPHNDKNSTFRQQPLKLYEFRYIIPTNDACNLDIILQKWIVRMKRLVCLNYEHQYYSNRERIVQSCNGKLQFNLATLNFYLFISHSWMWLYWNFTDKFAFLNKSSICINKKYHLV